MVICTPKEMAHSRDFYLQLPFLKEQNHPFLAGHMPPNIKSTFFFALLAGKCGLYGKSNPWIVSRSEVCNFQTV